jgi:hypothetical protein
VFIGLNQIMLHCASTSAVDAKIESKVHLIALSKVYKQDFPSLLIRSFFDQIIWDRTKRVLRTFTINGLPIQTSALDPEDGDIGALAVSADGQFLVLGTDTSRVSANLSRRPSIAEPVEGSGRRESEIEEEASPSPEGSGFKGSEQGGGVKWERGTGVGVMEEGPPPGILLLELHTLRVSVIVLE